MNGGPSTLLQAAFTPISGKGKRRATRSSTDTVLVRTLIAAVAKLAMEGRTEM